MSPDSIAEASPRPWRVTEFGNANWGFEIAPAGSNVPIVDVNSNDGADEAEWFPARANAQLIVTAVNAYDHLLAENAEAESRIATLEKELAGYKRLTEQAETLADKFLSERDVLEKELAEVKGGRDVLASAVAYGALKEVTAELAAEPSPAVPEHDLRIEIDTGWHPDFKCQCGFEIASAIASTFKFCPHCGREQGETK